MALNGDWKKALEVHMPKRKAFIKTTKKNLGEKDGENTAEKEAKKNTGDTNEGELEGDEPDDE